MSSNSDASSARWWFRACLTLCLLVISKPASAISVNAVYRSACDREIGVIIDVQKRELTLLGLDGAVRTIPRYEVVSIAYYPVSSVNVDPAQVHASHPAMRVRTMQDGQLVALLDGWPVDFNQERIAFLNVQGQEIIVNRNRIWSLEYLQTLPLRANMQKPRKLNFVHPHAVGFCNESLASDARTLFPQQFINDQIVIKRELDRLMEGHTGVREYERDQVFYPKPQLYENETALGLWTSHGRKHGASSGRPNNFTPVLTDELSLGPFGYQHRMVTGSAPMPFSVHTETQTQIYYRFKAAYFHASAMFDPNLLLVGEKYQWSHDELRGDQPDARINEALMVEFGFDYGPLALQISPGALAFAAARTQDLSVTEERALFRVGPRLTMHFWSAELLVGVSDRNTQEPIRWLRLNANLQYSPRLNFNGSFLARSMEARVFDEESAALVEWRLTDQAYAAAIEGSYSIFRRYDVGARLSGEAARTDAENAGVVRRGNSFALVFAWFIGLNF